MTTTTVRETYTGSLNQRIRITQTAGVSPWIFVAKTVDVTALPGGGGTMSIETSNSPASFLEADNASATSTASAVVWTPATVSAVTRASFTGLTAIRITATTATGVCDIST